MRALALLGVLSSSSFAIERNLLIQAPPEKAKRKGIVDRIFQKLDGGDLHGFEAPYPLRKPENFLHTLTVRWKFSF